MFGHFGEILALLVLGLIIFGPKRMIEMGGQAGRMWRELREAMKDMNWNPLGDGSPANSPQSTLGKLSQLAQDLGGSSAANDPQPAVHTDAADVVEAGATPTNDPPVE